MLGERGCPPGLMICSAGLTSRLGLPSVLSSSWATAKPGTTSTSGVCWGLRGYLGVLWAITQTHHWQNGVWKALGSSVLPFGTWPWGDRRARPVCPGPHLGCMLPCRRWLLLTMRWLQVTSCLPAAVQSPVLTNTGRAGAPDCSRRGPGGRTGPVEEVADLGRYGGCPGRRSNWC